MRPETFYNSEASTFHQVPEHSQVVGALLDPHCLPHVSVTLQRELIQYKSRFPSPACFHQ